MARHTYKTALRAKGVRPVPPHHRLRSHHGELAGEHHVIATAALARRGIDFSKCRRDRFCRGRCCKPGSVA